MATVASTWRNAPVDLPHNPLANSQCVYDGFAEHMGSLWANGPLYEALPTETIAEPEETTTTASAGYEDELPVVSSSSHVLVAALKRVFAEKLLRWDRPGAGDKTSDAALRRDALERTWRALAHLLDVTGDAGAIIGDPLRDSGIRLGTKAMNAACERLTSVLGKWRGRVLGLEGVIGAGKSTLCRSLKALSDATGVTNSMLREGVPDALLKQFFSNPDLYAFSFQTALMFKRYSLHTFAMVDALKGAFVIQDRTLIGDSVFVLQGMHGGRLSEQNVRDYADILAGERAVCRCDVVLYLVTSDARAKERVAERDRGGEREFYLNEKPRYLSENVSCYDELFRCILDDEPRLAAALHVMPLDWNNPPPPVPWGPYATEKDSGVTRIDLLEGRLGTPATLDRYAALLESALVLAEQN